jgi:predicted acyl esterase
MVSGEIFRGRYRKSFETAEAIKSNEPFEYTIRLPQVNHTFLKGHYIMVHVQSTWFPLYDRNPQRFVPSIMDGKPEDYEFATHRIHFSSAFPSRIELTVEDQPVCR